MEKVFATIVLAGFFGVIFKIIAYRLRIPAIVPFLIGGILLGPYGIDLIHPEYLGNGLTLIISVCIGIILFEGGLSLHVQGYHSSPKVIRRLLSTGLIITWLITAAIAKFFLGFSYGYSLLLGSLIVVTGPSVITPILQRIKVKQNLKHILNWEAVVIDPIGAFLAILCFEWLATQGTFASHLMSFSLRFLTGSALGFGGGFLLYLLIKRRIIPPAYNIIFTLVFILLIYYISNHLSTESGLLAVVVGGFTFALFNPHGLQKIQHFKFELSELALAILFVLLASNLRLENFLQLNAREIILIVAVSFFIRPLSIFVCSYGSDLKSREKAFLSWIAPRGIVAASIASLFSIELRRLGFENADFIETFVYAVIIITVVIQGATAELFANILKLNKDKTPVIVFIGANRFSRKLALAIEEKSNIECFLIDTNHMFIELAMEQGLKAIEADAQLPEEINPEITSSAQTLIVLTDNIELNTQICEAWVNYLSNDSLYYWGDRIVDEKIGKAIWDHIPKPSNISFELKNDKNEFVISSSNGDSHIHYKEHLLLTIKNKESTIKIV